MNASGPPHGLFAALRQLLGTALELAQVRLQLLGNDLEQEKLRIFNGLLLASAGLALLAVGIVLFCGFVLLLMAENYRLATLGIMVLLFFIGAGLLLRTGNQCLRAGKPFEATLAELAQDRTDLTATNNRES